MSKEIKLRLPPGIAEWMAEEIKKEQYGSTNEYIRHLLLREMHRKRTQK